MKRRSLAYLLEFCQEDLEANRQGYMTKEQRRFHRANGREIAGLKGLFTGCFLGSMVGGLIGGGIAHIVVIFSSFNQIQQTQLLTTVTNIGALIGCLVVAYTIGRLLYVPYQRDLYKSKVETVSGRVHLRKRTQGTGAIYRISIQNEAFDIPKELFDAFDDGDTYAIYYAEYSRTILSAERIKPEIPESVTA